MRRPQLSTGAWLFCGIVAAALIAPAGVYAAVNSRVAIGNPANAVTATVTNQHQLMTTTVAPNQVIRAVAVSQHVGCKPVYTPPAHKAIVVTAVIYDFGSGVQGTEHFGGLSNATCGPAYDQIDGVQAYDTIEHTFPIGLPIPSVGLANGGQGDITVFVYGYLIDSTALPPAAASNVSGAVKGMSTGR
jgi:hypothetical protein